MLIDTLDITVCCSGFKTTNNPKEPGQFIGTRGASVHLHSLGTHALRAVYLEYSVKMLRHNNTQINRDAFMKG
jgi:hypothetical protein